MSTATPLPQKEISLDVLQQEVEGLLSLLKDRQPGLSTWNSMVANRLEKLYVLSGAALGK